MASLMDEKVLGEIDEIFKNNSEERGGETLCHFTSVDALYSIINSQSLRITNSMYMNDRVEFKEFLRAMTEASEELSREITDLVEKEIVLELYDKYIEELHSHVNSESDFLYRGYYIFSTCSQNISIPMWNYYSNGAGICIEFDRDELLKSLEEKVLKSNSPKPFKNNDINNHVCLYNDQEKIKVLKNVISIAMPDLRKRYDEDRDYFTMRFWNAMLKYSYMFKDSIFEYENEERFIICIGNDENSDDIKLGFYSTGETIRPCLNIKYQDRLPIKKIYVSPFNHNETVTNGIKRFLIHHGYKDVIVERMSMNIRNKY